MDREEVLQAVFQEKWEPIISWLHKNQRAIATDDHLQFAADIFTKEFFTKLPTYPLDRPEISTHLATLLSFHKGRTYQLDSAQYKILVVQTATRQSDPAVAHKLALEFPTEPACQQIIQAYKRKQPKPVTHSQSHTIQVTQQASIAAPGAGEHRIPLFKSHQEKQFFQALKNTFPAYHVYPNVAVSCLLNLSSLNSALTPAERDMFFKGIIDCVIFDQAQDYLPLYFFELDSVHHDNERAQKNDQAKDSLLAKAGVKLRRIRKLDQLVSEADFTRLIRELLRDEDQ